MIDRSDEAARSAGAIDCHAHVYPRGYAFARTASYRMSPHELDDYRAMSRRLGIARTVFSTPSVYGTDNRSLIDTLAEAGGWARGVVNLAFDVRDAEIARLADAGACGVRLSSSDGAITATSVAAWSKRLARHRWHLDLLLRNVGDLDDLAETIARSPVPVVLDHLGRTRGDDFGSPAFKRLLELLEGCRHVWVKLSSWYRLSSMPFPHPDMEPVARALIAARPGRLLWGTNWPHPAYARPLPEDGRLLDVVMSWMPDEATARAILVDNPAVLYGFPRG